MNRPNEFKDHNIQKDIEWAIGINRNILKIVGLWPQDSKNLYEALLLKLKLLITIIMLVFVITIPILLLLIRVWGDRIQIIENMQYLLPSLLTMVKIFIMVCKKKALLSLIDMIVEDWMRVKVKEERIVMLKYAGKSRMLIICLVAIMFFTMVITDRGKPLVIQVYYKYNISKSPQFDDLTFYMQEFSLLFSCLSYTGVDSFLGLLILHICGQLENLHLRLLNQRNNPNFKAALKFNVKDHVRLIRSVKTVDDVFNLMLLSLLFLYSILFCLQGFSIVSVITHQEGYCLSFMKLTYYITINVCMLAHMCLYCAVGEFLVSHSEKIYHATCENVWYDLEPKEAKNLMLIMLRAKKPLQITVGKIFPMTMTTFCNLLKTSGGFISVLLANQD